MNSLPETVTEIWGDVIIWWFPRDFSQSRIGDKCTGSNACTLIALLVAHQCYKDNINISPGEQRLSSHIITALAESIMEGNEIHRQLLQKGNLQYLNMTVPEAMAAAKSKIKFITEWRSYVYLLDLGASLYEQMNDTLADWFRNPPARKGSELFVILIAENRSVLFVFQKDQNKVTLIDTHQHLNHGAVIAQVETPNLEALCAWYAVLLRKCYAARPECYELSFLYFKSYEAGEMTAG
ncbi:uncharacterized protein LOC126458411 isoform X2 [Schistocerca serialis cubense]|uniref:uncharacterized protein LOC126335336 n=1 Tax=Schistocerca gregaria TaxID=7010 RepID=UPI002117B86E|nr:uncharacterized protein LOC126162825 isoform X1 [Schistocerca cancellata]XP_049775539.1 uncharacterized protein LOC126162825 isoform X1 [Schistocerca cancellata]XP_049800703.1 uncharacterized protein LOC126235860 isoform X1 [Schistocerca nitens]XP_049800704.1 uncharacterized protein LOC126235860 isoform X1 [Schistocerca nitens]XP_049800706.1 uncharacterized protein LOC126235860 isoform X1 [Schistocerca nitens]XP_049800707.1 uncharacterized protein LOC126235860 isoform X1 [Schistocerca niten